MCWVSAISQPASQLPIGNWTPPLWNDFQEIIKRLDAMDKKLGLPDCQDPAKTAWMKQVEERIRKLEAEAKKELPSICGEGI